MTKQTVIEWLREIYNSRNTYEKFIANIDWEQAKSMEKENLYNFYIQGGVDAIKEADRNVEQYYKETFKI